MIACYQCCMVGMMIGGAMGHAAITWRRDTGFLSPGSPRQSGRRVPGDLLLMGHLAHSQLGLQRNARKAQISTLHNGVINCCL